MKKAAIIGLIALAIILVGSLLVFNRQADAPESTQAETTTQSAEKQSESAEDESTALTKAEVAKHNTKEDCWTIISGSVYNITSYISRHSGGDEILRACGTDATTLFTQRQTSDGEQVGSGTPHSSSAHSQLEQFKLGDLQ